MFARIHSLTTTPEQHEAGLKIVRDDLLAWMRDSTGFRGVIRLTDRASAKTLVITLWDSEESLQASASAADQHAELATSVSGATRGPVESYEVTQFELA